MSLGGAGSAGTCTDGGLREAICHSVRAGVPYAVAAGNDAVNASGYVPASFPEVITVSALADFNGAPGGGAARHLPLRPGRHARRLLQLRRRRRPHRPRRVHPLHLDGRRVQHHQRHLDGHAPRGRGGRPVPLRPPRRRPDPGQGRSAVRRQPELVDRRRPRRRQGDASSTSTPCRHDPRRRAPAASASAASSPAGIQLTARGYKVKGTQHVDLTWTGAYDEPGGRLPQRLRRDHVHRQRRVGRPT